MKWNLIPYEKQNGEKPVTVYLNSLDTKHRVKVLRNLQLLEEFGPTKEMREKIKPLGNGIFELRTQFSNNIFRILYFHLVDKNLILTNGFTKKTEKTPPREIKKAKDYRDDFLKRKGDQR
ncbi:MAG: type II toxin-antitoxin system RelE/ParE family toxin [Sporolactobacillus sp.]|uniref:type II toxin-antitoxin system RelE/ParE family toxin n=1 Tax=Sporolactobacillus sp. STSJ-5 TaxID=2965076 RepID=UPI00210503B4|nr:type II toxin-antitoxin system RelE/ParE family toxin [Sporolactobacillus sp. STSJ-5]MCQ2009183.1 type II toxin-antitoxin system RelE/ParE family toxin [Sporolactobacillus sp. STSJ-5]